MIDDTKEYYLVDEEATALARAISRAESRIVGCKAAHVISFFPDGVSIKKWPTIKHFMDDNSDDDQFLEDVDVDDDYEEVENEEFEEEVTWTDCVDYDDKFSLIENESFIAIKAHKSTIEQFHLYKVLEKKRAEERIQDASGEHWILKGEPYMIGQWYSYLSEGKKFAQYAESRSTESACIHVAEVFFTGIELDEKTRMDIQTYRMLSSSV